jgi:hypothetical protein
MHLTQTAPAIADGHTHRCVSLTRARANGTALLDTLSWKDFESLIREAFQRDGYLVVETGGGSTEAQTWC